MGFLPSSRYKSVKYISVSYMHWLHVAVSVTYHVFVATGLCMPVEPPGGYRWLMRKLSNVHSSIGQGHPWQNILLPPS